MNRIGTCGRLAALIMAGCTLASEARCAYPPGASLDDVRQCIAKAPQAHPRLLVAPSDLEALRESLAADPFRRALADGVVKELRPDGVGLP